MDECAQRFFMQSNLSAQDDIVTVHMEVYVKCSVIQIPYVSTLTFIKSDIQKYFSVRHDGYTLQHPIS